MDQEKNPLISFHNGVPLPEDPVVFSSWLKSENVDLDVIPVLSEISSVFSSSSIISFTCIDSDQVLFGEKTNSLISTINQNSVDEFLCLGTYTDGSLILLHGNINDIKLDNFRISFVSNGYPNSTNEYNELISNIGLTELTQTITPRLPALTVDFRPDSSRTDMKVDDNKINHYVVEKESEYVVGLIIENILDELSIDQSILDDSNNSVDGELYTLHKNKFSHQLEEQLSNYSEIYCPIETPHPVDKGTEYGISSITIIELTELIPQRSVWNISLKCNTLASPLSTTEIIRGKIRSLFTIK